MKVGIGVATGADDVFIGPFDALDVEPDCKLPLVMTRDILAGTSSGEGLASSIHSAQRASWSRYAIIRNWRRISNTMALPSRVATSHRKIREAGIGRIRPHTDPN